MITVPASINKRLKKKEPPLTKLCEGLPAVFAAYVGYTRSWVSRMDPKRSINNLYFTGLLDTFITVI